jgi:hypothetical protein
MDAGHAFYVLTSDVNRATWLYDVVTGAWTEWPSWNTAAGLEEASLVMHRATAFGRYLGDSRTSGALYTVSGDVYSDNGAAIRRVRQVPFPKLSPEAIWIFLSALEIFLRRDRTAERTGERSDGHPADHQTAAAPGDRADCSADGRQYLTKVFWSVGGATVTGSAACTIFTDPVPWRINGAAFAEAGTH